MLSKYWVMDEEGLSLRWFYTKAEALAFVNNNEMRKTFMSTRPPTQTTTHEVYCDYMGYIEAIK